MWSASIGKVTFGIIFLLVYRLAGYACAGEHGSTHNTNISKIDHPKPLQIYTGYENFC